MTRPFEGDAFISYAHLDNIELIEGRKGWVANLYRALDVRVAQLLGSDAQIWWDPKLQGNDYFADTLVERLQRVAALVAIVSPRYVKSEWGRKELSVFCEAAGRQGGLRVGDKSRLFKVLKTPVPLDQHPNELSDLLGYEFFRFDPETGKIRELDEIFGPDAQREFWLKLDDLAHDICATLKLLNSDEADAEAAGADAPAAVYLAMTTGELKDEWLALKRDLEQHGHIVLPDRALPLNEAEATRQIREDLARSQLSVHLVGSTYSLVPEGGRASIIELQYELAVQRSPVGRFSRLVWIPPDLQVVDERQRAVIQALRMDPRTRGNADLLETPLEDLRTVISSWLDRGREEGSGAGQRADANTPLQLYLLYDKRDQQAVLPWADYLFKDFEVLHPLFEGEESEIRDYHEENLRHCAGALIFYGSANEAWLRRKIRELKKCVGYGRVGPSPVIGICLIPPKTAEKERFRTHEALVVPQWAGLSPDALEKFVSRMKEHGESGSRDGAPDSA
jgi:hypothetical protein